MSAYYNEFDPFAAAWLRELIKGGHIAAGEVDERSIDDVQPSDLAGFTQCHFFAGIGVWSYALRRAGWPDDKPVWTGSCPCQPFSAAGKRKGTADLRHLWPSWFHLISERKPVVVFGEQVEAAVRHGWLDLVQDDLEGIGYTVGAVGSPAAGYGAPHIRGRLYFVAESNDLGYERSGTARGRWDGLANCGAVRSRRPADDLGSGPQGRLSGRADSQRSDQHGHVGRGSAVGELEQPREFGRERREATASSNDDDRRAPERSQSEHGTRFTSSYWGGCDWIPCKDGKWRPVEPGTFPLAHGAAARVGRLRGYGNAIVAPQAEAFVRAYLGGN